MSSRQKAAPEPKKSASDAPLKRRESSSRRASEASERPHEPESVQISHAGTTSLFAPSSAHTATAPQVVVERPSSQASHAGSILPKELTGKGKGKAPANPGPVVVSIGGRAPPLTAGSVSDSEVPRRTETVPVPPASQGYSFLSQAGGGVIRRDEGTEGSVGQEGERSVMGGQYEADTTYREADTGMSDIDTDDANETMRTIDPYSKPQGWGYGSDGMPISPSTRARQVRDRRLGGAWLPSREGEPSMSIGLDRPVSAKGTTMPIIGVPMSSDGFPLNPMGMFPVKRNMMAGPPVERPTVAPNPQTNENEGSDGNFTETREEATGSTRNVGDQSRTDYAAVMEIFENPEPREALRNFQLLLRETGQDRGVVTVDTDSIRVTEENAEPKPAHTPKPKSKTKRLSLGVSFRDLEDERRAHIPAQTPVRPSTTRGMPSGGYLHQKLVADPVSTQSADPDDEGSSSSSSSSSSDDDSDDYDNMTPREIMKQLKKLKREKRDRKNKGKVPTDNGKPKQSAKAVASDGKKRRVKNAKKAEKNEEAAVGVEEAKENAYTPEIEQEGTTSEILTKLPEAHVFADSEGSIVEAVKDKYEHDNFFKLILANPSQFRNFIVDGGVIYILNDSGKALCVPDAEIDGEKLREVVIRDTHRMLAHTGYRKTKYAMRGRVWWRSMVQDVRDYCASCRVCATSKHQTQSKSGLLMPLKQISEPWRRIQVDFVGPLPESENLQGKWDMLCVFIDQATSMVRLVPTKQTYRAKDVAEVFFDNIYKLHGMPEVIVSDRDKLFTSKFWRELHRLTGVQLRMSSGYHPETDGLTERSNQSAMQKIRQSIEGRQKDWVKCLPSVEHAMNLARSDSTGFSPFFLNYGRYPTGSVWNTDSIYPGVRTLLTRQKEALQMAHDQLIDSRTRMTAQANKHRRPADFKVGDLVFLSSKNMRLPKKVSRKLVPKYIGPHRIVKEVSPGTTYEIDLPLDLKNRGIHPVFHASLLRIHVPNDDRRFPGRSAEQVVPLTDAPKEWAVESILQHAGKGKETEFEVKWKSGDVTWHPYRVVKSLEAFDEYLELQGASSVMELKWTAEYGDEEREFEDEKDENERVKGEKEEIKEEETGLKAFSIAFADMLQVQPLFPVPTRPTVYSFTSDDLVDCGIYRATIAHARRGLTGRPSQEPERYQDFRSMLRVLAEAEGRVRRAFADTRHSSVVWGLQDSVRELTALIRPGMEHGTESGDAYSQLGGGNNLLRRTGIVTQATGVAFQPTGVISRPARAASQPAKVATPTAPKALKGPTRPSLAQRLGDAPLSEPRTPNSKSKKEKLRKARKAARKAGKGDVQGAGGEEGNEGAADTYGQGDRDGASDATEGRDLEMADGHPTGHSQGETPGSPFETFGPITFGPRADSEEVINEDDWLPFDEAD